MRGQEQPVLVAPGRVFRLDDVQKTCSWNFDTLDHKRSPFAPDRLEVEAFHDECEIDLQIIRACDPRESMTRYHLLRQPEIAGSIEGLIPEP